MRCKKGYTMSEIKASQGIPQCTCGGIIKPDVVLYEEGLDDNVVMGAVREIAHAKTLIIGGTSLVVYPAAGLVQYFHGENLIVINRTPTSADVHADVCFMENLGKVFTDVMKQRGQ